MCNSSVTLLLPFPGLCNFPQTARPSSPIFHGCVNEHLADRTPSPTFSTTDSEITELADERQSEMSDLIDDEAFVDDTSSDTGTEEGSDIFSDGQDPFYDRSPWFILVGRLVVLHIVHTQAGRGVWMDVTQFAKLNKGLKGSEDLVLAQVKQNSIMPVNHRNMV